MEFGIYIFALILVLTGLFLIARLRPTRDGRDDDARRDQRWHAYEERQRRVRRDRVWWRVESLYEEFNERQRAGGETREQPAAAAAPAPKGADSGTFTPERLRAAFEQFTGARRGGRDAGG